ncbi:hypothetical protein [Stieleria magnilauensis]|uniref:Uncharacterized protein n=1 Tax=Stieleria magnilauensis TaxID=2527963 RepID=A0ABX5XX50_9BACT|nr:hypothetical protein TBK1r_56060 [Planctomycetes bacterium TBK1r]
MLTPLQSCSQALPGNTLAQKHPPRGVVGEADEQGKQDAYPTAL